MQRFSKQDLKLQLEEINNLISTLNKHPLGINKPTTGRVKSSSKAGFIQYYLTLPGEKKAKYVRLNEMDNVKKIVQQDYNHKAYVRLIDSKNALEHFLKKYRFEEVADIYENMSEGRKRLVTPLIESEEEFVKNWYNKYSGTEKNGFIDELKYPTDRGEYVRSKSEKILADLFAKNNIPYIYEPEIALGPNKVVFPDFVLLNTETRTTFLWEHLGMISDSEYAAKNLKKLERYEKYGYFLGENLIISTESNDSPLDIQLVKEKIRKYLKGNNA